MKKYIFYIDSMQMGGAQRVMNNLVDFFVYQGNEVVLVNDIKPSLTEPEYTINPKVRRVFLDGSESKGLRKNLNRIKKLKELLISEKPDLVVSFLGPPNIRALIASVGLKVKNVVSVRNDPCREYGTGLKKLVAQHCFLFADGCVFQTKEATKYFFKRTAKKSKVIFNPVNLKFYEVAREEEDNHIVFIGRLQPQKNPQLMIEAFHQISRDFPETELDFYGDGELKETLYLLTKEYGIENRVHFHGQTSEVEKVLSRASVYVLTSDYEGMPNALMEAMAVGVPAIATDCPCGGPKSLIEREEQGVLIRCGRADDLVEALKLVLQNPTIRRDLGNNSKKRAEEFHPSMVFSQWEEYFNEVLLEH